MYTALHVASHVNYRLVLIFIVHLTAIHPNRLHYMACPSTCPVRASKSQLIRHRETKIGVNVPQEE